MASLNSPFPVLCGKTIQANEYWSQKQIQSGNIHSIIFSIIDFIHFFVELGWNVGDRDERYHDKIGVSFGPTGKCMSHDYLKCSQCQ